MNGSRERIRRTHEVLFEAGDVVEILAFKCEKSHSGYFDNRDAFVEVADKLVQLADHEIEVGGITSRAVSIRQQLEQALLEHRRVDR